MHSNASRSFRLQHLSCQESQLNPTRPLNTSTPNGQSFNSPNWAQFNQLSTLKHQPPTQPHTHLERQWRQCHVQPSQVQGGTTRRAAPSKPSKKHTMVTWERADACCSRRTQDITWAAGWPPPTRPPAARPPARRTTATTNGGSTPCQQRQAHATHKVIVRPRDTRGELGGVAAALNWQWHMLAASPPPLPPGPTSTTVCPQQQRRSPAIGDIDHLTFESGRRI